MIITIDGPTASGKSSVARAVAHDLSIFYLNTGLLYRALAYALIKEHGYSTEQCANPKEYSVRLVLSPGNLSYGYDKNKGSSVLLSGCDVTSLLKTPDIDRAASVVSAVPYVRTCLLTVQRDIASKHSVVAEGRDCGTVIFPYAEHKFFLIANQAVRAQRWQADQRRAGKILSLQDCCAAIDERDQRDAARECAPLVQAKDAICIDSSNMTLEETVAAIRRHLT